MVLPGLVIAIVGFMEAISIAKTVARQSGKGKIMANNELIAIGAANTLCSMFHGYPGEKW